MFNFQPVLFHQYYLCHLLWFKKQSFTLVWNIIFHCSVCCVHLRAPADEVSVALPMKHSRKCFSSRDQWNLTPATMCHGSAARRSSRPCTCTSATTSKKNLLGGGGGVVRLTAKPRYLLLLHRGDKKSNTVTALLLPLHNLSSLNT